MALKTSLQTINNLFPRGLPPLGVTLLNGPARSGKTTLAIDIVREYLKTPTAVVTVLTESPQVWRKAIPEDRLHIVAEFSGDENRVAGLVVVDSGPVNALVINFSTRGPVLLTAVSAAVTAAFANSSVLTLQLDRLEENLGRVTVVKPSYEVIRDPVIKDRQSALFRVDPALGLVPHDYKPPELKSAWDRLLGDEELV